MLYIENLYKTYGRFPAVQGLTLRVPKGDLFGFVGPNGAGKTTTIRIVCGLLQATSGSVTVNGITSVNTGAKPASNKDMKAFKKTIGYVPDFFGVYDNLKVTEYLEFYGSLNGMTYREIQTVSDDLLALVNLQDKKDFYVDTLSRGMKQRLCVARALLHNPELMVMDEPSSGLDPVARVEMKELLMNLQSMGKTIVISSHILADISEMCNAIGIMSQGRLVTAGKMEDILKIGTDTSRLVLTLNQGIENVVMMLQEYNNIRIESVRENQIIIAGVTDDYMASRLAADLINRGVVLGGFHRDEKSLEQIFMNITGGGN
ncbi:MAG: ABC transporter ATP-binding protein [Eubacterium sp.]|nr:ABC transporter ATP-binding protein [Eubacterium sp.]